MDVLFRSFAQTKNQLFQRAGLIYSSNWLPWIIILFGVVLRTVQYLSNRSLWLDESLLALNIVDKSFLELLGPLSYGQGAPVGFLILEKLAVQTFGNSEYSLRLVPFMSGIISLFLFYGVTKLCIKPKAVPIALGLFAISESLIYYSTEVKQYSSDVAIALLLVYIFMKSKRFSTQGVILFGVLGAISIWFSHISVFILVGGGVSITLFHLSRKERGKIASFSIAFSLGALSLIANYFISLRNLSKNEALLDFWGRTFMPFPPTSSSDADWFVTAFFGIFENPVMLPLTGIAALAFLVGFISLFLEKKESFFILTSPIFLVLIASGLHMYPTGGRLLLFIVPFLLLFIAEGAEKIWNNSSITGVALIGLLFFHPLLSATDHLINPKTREEIKPVISYVKEHQEGGDILYLYYGSKLTFKYYSEEFGYKDADYIIKGKSSRDNWSSYANELNGLRGNKRVWILFSHVYTKRGVDEEKFFLFLLESRGGIRLDSFRSDGAAVYLYDLSKE